MLDTLAARHRGQLVVVACHAGVIEASLLAKLPVAGGLTGARLQLRTQHASMTSWEIDGGRWRLLGFNDAAHLQPCPGAGQSAAVRSAGVVVVVGGAHPAVRGGHDRRAVLDDLDRSLGQVGRGELACAHSVQVVAGLSPHEAAQYGTSGAYWAPTMAFQSPGLA